MVIDVKKLLREGKTGCTFSFVAPKDDDYVSIPNVDFDGDITVTGSVEIEGKAVYVDAEVSYTLKGLCSRCLSPASKLVVEPMNVRFVEQNPEDDDYTYKSGVVDLTQAVRENVLGSMPYAIYCKDDCKGLCSVCGANLNVSTCEHQNNG